MSDPSTTPLPAPPALPTQPHHHQPPLIQGVATAPTTSSTPLVIREYRKGNWTIQETLILITAKKLDDERRLKVTATSNSSTPSSSSSISACGSRNTGELRWKWVENYCWSHGCLRSQNQCNDKWDNLLRDYKKVRDYESKILLEYSSSNSSYWTLNKQQRKEQNLPSNMIFEVYQAISEVLQRKQTQRIITTTITTPLSQPHPIVTIATPPPLHATQPSQPPPPPPPPPLPLPQQPPPPPPQAPAGSTTPAVSEKSQSSKSTDQSDGDGSESKRRKIRNLGSSIMKSATVLARALRTCEEEKAKRHREMMELEQRRIRMEEARNEVHRQGIATLVAAVTDLSGAIQSLINSDQHHGQR
ncbi:unnamed protein product [Lupinus luteus]|uniref:Myb-like domain-containing protein n=1 Tax=Lupinus luteus TaxID=3873 RepID=A0AAV1VS94_LUPLU